MMNHFFTFLLAAFCLTAVGQVPDYVPTGGLVGWWPLDGDGIDHSANEYHGTLSDAVQVGENRYGQVGSALVFDGESAMVSISHSSLLNLSEDFTISSWIYSINPPVGGASHTIVAKRGWPDGVSVPYNVSINYQYNSNSHKKPLFGSKVNSFTFRESMTAIENDTWHHLLISYASPELKFYLDGIELESFQLSQAERADNLKPLQIGGWGASDEFFEGSIDDVGIWNRALTDLEIFALHMGNPLTMGCTNIDACNFDPEANSDDGSCLYLDACGECGGNGTLGCIDSYACNFSSEATCDDGGCDYSCCPGPGCCGAGTTWNWQTSECDVANPSDSNFDGCVQLNDLLDLLSAYGDCAAEESPWQCGDPLEYQGYDYETVQIGEQCWFAENLRAESYRNGDAIPTDLSDSEWAGTAEGAKDYGPLGVSYNGFAVVDGRQLCPIQWHVSLDADWIEMETFLGMDSVDAFGWRGTNQGTTLKSTTGWSNDGNGTDAVGFSARPESHRQTSGSYIDELAIWWCLQADALISRNLNPSNEGVYRYQGQLQNDGLSVRCIKDSE